MKQSNVRSTQSIDLSCFSKYVVFSLSQTNTFQCVVTSDAVSTFVFFLYKNIGWTTDSRTGGDAETGIGVRQPQVTGTQRRICPLQTSLPLRECYIGAHEESVDSLPGIYIIITCNITIETQFY